MMLLYVGEADASLLERLGVETLDDAVRAQSHQTRTRWSGRHLVEPQGDPTRAHPRDPRPPKMMATIGHGLPSTRHSARSGQVIGFAEMMTIKLGELIDQPRHVRVQVSAPCIRAHATRATAMRVESVLLPSQTCPCLAATSPGASRSSRSLHTIVLQAFKAEKQRKEDRAREMAARAARQAEESAAVSKTNELNKKVFQSHRVCRFDSNRPAPSSRAVAPLHTAPPAFAV